MHEGEENLEKWRLAVGDTECYSQLDNIRTRIKRRKLEPKSLCSEQGGGGMEER